mgnify:CR=1 FL=1
MQSNTVRTFTFAFVMCVVCSILLTAAAVGLKDRQQRNIRVDQQKNILKSMGMLESDRSYVSSEIESLYETSVQKQFVTADGVLLDERQSDQDLEVFLLKKEGEIQRYAIPFKAYGLWSWVYGYFALQGDGRTVSGMTVYQHGETPGLGGECEKPWFQNQFKGKQIVDASGNFVSIGIAKGSIESSVPEAQHGSYVDGMSGATITSKGLEKYLKEVLAQYEPFSRKLREVVKNEAD